MAAMLPRHDEPIVAIATAPGRAGIGIVRASGADLSSLVVAVCGRPLAPRHATFLPFRDADGAALDQGIALYFPAPHSATGEEVLELQAHGGPVVLQLLLARLLDAGAAIGLRLARPGEFSERAYLNGKLDLAQAEAVADLIDASTEAAARSAVRSLAGAFSRDVHAVRDALIDLRLLVEATLDFPDEEIDLLRDTDALARLQALVAQLDSVLARTRHGALLQRGLVVVIAGQPNVGKSSLLNALSGAELAIVSPIAGTTRDKVAAMLQIGGLPVQVIDTAGLRETDDPVERIGVERAWAAIAEADAVLLLHDASRAGDAGQAAADTALAMRLPETLGRVGRVLHVHTKSDLLAVAVAAAAAAAAAAATDVDSNADGAGAIAPADAIAVSAHTGAGLDRLRERLLAIAGAEPASEDSYTARTRHVVALQRVHMHLVAAVGQLDGAVAALDLCAEELRLAQEALAAVTGEFTADDLLGEIFGRFCIGK